MVQIPVADEFLSLDRTRPANAVGNKAHNLSVMCGAGVRVPPGFVVPFDATIDGDALTAAARQLGDVLVVRSSASAEDGDAHAAPGLFESVRDVAANDVAAAVQTVRNSASAARIAGYPFAESVRMAVIVQRQVAGIGGTTYSRTTAGPAVMEARREAGVQWVASAGDDGTTTTDAGFPIDARVLLAAARECEAALGRQGLDIEWVHDGEALWVVQARPLGAAGVKPLIPLDRFAFTRGDERLWRWDAEHNPRPLSCAQAGLVERVDAAGVAGYSMRVVDGYLYFAAGGEDPVAGFETADEVAECFEQMARALAPLANPPPAGAGRGGRVAAMLDRYVEFYRVYAPGAARLAATDPAVLGAAVSEDVNELLADAAPEWDVACPPYGDGTQLDPAAARYLSRPGERDDLYFCRAQRQVRDALLELAEQLGLEQPGDVFWVPLDQLCATSPPPADELARLAADMRARADRQALWRMPIAVRDGAAIDANTPGRDVWRGHGTGGRVCATVANSPNASEIREGQALVAATITPQMVLQAQRAACLVSDHGGPLGHAIAMARELGIPCVVGCRGVSTQLVDGDQILVDGSAGVVFRLPRD